MQRSCGVPPRSPISLRPDTVHSGAQGFTVCFVGLELVRSWAPRSSVAVSSPEKGSRT